MRERAMILVAVAVFFSILTVPFARGLARDYRDSRANLAEARDRLRSAGQLRQVVVEEREARKLIAERIGADQRFNLYEFVQSSLTGAGLADRMRLEKRGAASQSMEVVSVSISNVGLEELVAFLHSAYSASRPVAMQQLDYLRPSRDGKGLDCSLTLMSPRL
jgi:hypothetical protein